VIEFSQRGWHSQLFNVEVGQVLLLVISEACCASIYPIV
jgi:hypothetical protein